ncbi:MarR family winged helix-turn-helix transcriptional regulator [Streptomyces sp. NPDC058464]|uniref:MarR family winged helix-turn-helix transcriptional regulator n=1 Tax=Streptomyces sp. NPDC058464 TaxID=3346511 RepID=UPI003653FE84
MADEAAGRPDGQEYADHIAALARLADVRLSREAPPSSLARQLPPESWRALSFGHGLIQVAKWIERQVETEFARPAGLSFAGFRMMSALKLNGPQAPSELADQLSLSRASVTSSLDTLERARLVVRVPQPDDGRRLLITLTPEGEGVVEEFLKWLSGQPEQAWFETLTREEMVVLDYLLRKAAANQGPVPRIRRKAEDGTGGTAAAGARRPGPQKG